MTLCYESPMIDLYDGDYDEYDISTYSDATKAIIWVFQGIGITSCIENDDETPVPYVLLDYPPGPQGTILQGNVHGTPQEVEIGGASSGTLYIREFSNGGRGTDIDGLTNRFRYKLQLVK